MATLPPPTGESLAATRLLEAAAAVFETLNVEVDESVAEVVHGLAQTGAARLAEEGRGEDPRGIRAAEVRLVYVLVTASIRAETPDLSMQQLQSFPERGTVLRASDLSEFLDGICPIWPFCT